MLKKELEDKLNAAIPGCTEKIYYCFLSRVFIRKGKPDLYELAFTSKSFDCVLLYRTCSLMNILTFGYHYDFSVEDHYLKCNEKVQVETGDSLLDSTLDTVLSHERQDSIFSFITDGSNSDYIIIDGSIAETPGDWAGTGITAFCNIRFSKSTMSIYAPLMNKGGLFNKMLVVEEGGKLLSRPFYYGTREHANHSRGEFVRKKMINGVGYDIYYVDALPIYDNLGRILSAPVINSAVQAQACHEFVIDCLEDIQREAYSVTEDKPEWVGGTKQYTSCYKVEFISTLGKFKKRERINILNSIMSGETSACAYDPRVRFLKNAIDSLELGPDSVPTLNSLHSTIVYLKKCNIHYGAYLTLVRYHMFRSHEKISYMASDILYGGISQEATIVREGF